MTKEKEKLAKKTKNTKTQTKKTVLEEFKLIKEVVNKVPGSNLEDKIINLYSHLNNIKQDKKRNSPELELLLKGEINILLKNSMYKEDVIKLDNFYTPTKPAKKFKLKKLNLQKLMYLAGQYWEAFMFTIPDNEIVEFDDQNIVKPSIANTSQYINSNENDHVLNYNNSVFEYYHKNKTNKLKKLIKTFNSFKNNIGVSNFSLTINTDVLK
jgi:hypothetical protein